MDIVELTTETIDYHALTEAVRSNNSGAVLLFLGTVREMTGDKQTDSLEYQAYPAMAKAKMSELIQEARDRWPIERAGIIHRFGHLDLGEISVAIAVSCPHRVDAFAAGRHLIDRLKQVVPIWKKENWHDGSTEWVHPGIDSEQPPPPLAEKPS